MSDFKPLDIHYTFADVVESIHALAENGIGFEEARIRMVNSLKITMAEATDRIEGAEAIAGIKLDRDGDEFPTFRKNVDELLAEDAQAERDGIRIPRQLTGLDDGPELQPRPRARVPRMSQDELEHFGVRCMVCGDLLSARRARGRKETCDKPECTHRLKQYRRAVIESKKCVACYHPSTPQEREDFKVWRKERGLMQRRRGNPHGRKPTTAQELLANNLHHIQDAMKVLKNSIPPGEKLTGWIAEFETFAQEAEKLFPATKPQ